MTQCPGKVIELAAMALALSAGPCEGPGSVLQRQEGSGTSATLTCYATYLLRDNMRMGWVGVITYVALASSLTCYATYLLRVNMGM
jgi:hypothetical protein